MALRARDPAATGDPACADKMLAAFGELEPGAASWVVDEMESGGLSRALPNVGPSDWEAFGQRARLRCSPGSTVLVRLPVALPPYAVSLRPLTISLSQFASMRHA